LCKNKKENIKNNLTALQKRRNVIERKMENKGWPAHEANKAQNMSRTVSRSQGAACSSAHLSIFLEEDRTSAEEESGCKGLQEALRVSRVFANESAPFLNFPITLEKL
jgi:hypothetical protein